MRQTAVEIFLISKTTTENLFLPTTGVCAKKQRELSKSHYVAHELGAFLLLLGL